MKKISVEALLNEKPSGNYSCPHYINPVYMHELAQENKFNLTDQSAKTLAEITENFAIEILLNCSTPNPSREEFHAIIRDLHFTRD